MTDIAYDELIGELTDREVRVLASAAAWYAKYHAPTVAQEADDASALAVVRREQYVELLTGLRKLGVSILPPDGIEIPRS